MILHLKAIDLNSHQIETWQVGIPESNLLYLEDVRWRGLENNYTRVHLISGKSVVVCETIGQIETQLQGVDMMADDGIIARITPTDADHSQ